MMKAVTSGLSRSFTILFCSLVAQAYLSTGIATPLNLANRPIYLVTSVEPNIFLVIDDSGSMDFEVLKSRGAQLAHTYREKDPLNVTPGTTKEKLENCVGYNVLAYNPDVTYIPWSGLDKNSDPFANQSYRSARLNPFNSAEGTIDLYDAFYFVWNDANQDGEYNNGECPTTSTSRVLVKNLASEQQTNYANWYSYYRKREYVAKTAYSAVVAKASGVRFGMMTINRNNSVNTPVRSMNSSFVAGNKRDLMDKLFSIDSNHGTPLRNAVYRAGLYLSGGDTTWLKGGSTEQFPDPRLPVGEGGACQQNFSIVMTDGYYNGDLDYSIGNEDGDNNTQWDGHNYKDTYQDTLADITMRYYERDLNSDAPPSVPIVKGIDENPDQHIVWYTVAFGVDGTLDRSPIDQDETFSWPDPTTSEATKIDDLRHAAYNGRGLFLNASDPQELIQSIHDSVGNLIERKRGFSGVAFNSTSLRTNNLVFLGRYETSDWSGHIDIMPVSSTGVIGGSIIDAADVLTEADPDARNILTWNTDSDSSVLFKWDALSTEQQSALNDAGSDSLGPDRLDYIRGDRSCEVSTLDTCDSGNKIFRSRTSLLGDIINSTVVYAGSPNKYYDFDGYETFVAQNENRTPVVYVGSNDGMLHAFNASVGATGQPIAQVTGQELFAYVPSMVYDNLPVLTSTLYTHHYFVDGTPVVEDVYFEDAWHTVLVGSLGAGGKGLFALDVTDPTNVTADKVLWEFTDPDLGYTFSQPSIVKLADGTWAAIFGNGYNGAGRAILYVVNVATGDLIRKIDTSSAGNGADFNDPAQHTDLAYDNGLATPAVVDVDGDFITDFVYAGDLYGNMWRFDFTGSDSADWTVSFDFTPLFKTESPDGIPQAITTKPSVGANPEQKGYMVYFGTGKYLEEIDKGNTDQPIESFYGIWDQWPKKTLPDGTVIVDTNDFSRFTRANLLDQWIVEQQVVYGAEVRTTSNNQINWNNHKGWYIDLVVGANTQGEKQVTNSLLRDGKIVFTTLISSLAVCDAGGSGWLMELDARDGSRLGDTPFDLNGDGVFNNQDLVVSPAAGGSTQNADVPVSGAKSQNGILSAPSLIVGEGGVVDYIGVSNTDGTIGLGAILGGTNSGSGGGQGSGNSGTTGSLVSNNRILPRGRVLYQILR
jgi:type IV pilus assembly protein PilY1